MRRIPRYRKKKNRLLKVCYVPATSARLSRLLFSFFVWLLTVLKKQTRQAGHAIKQSILLRCLWTDQITVFITVIEACGSSFTIQQSSCSKGISETNLKLQIPCSKCMHWPVTSQADACTSQADACMHCIYCPLCHRPMHAVTAWALLF